MRTTLDLPEDLLETARSIARGRKQTLGQAVADLMRTALSAPPKHEISISPITGLPVIHLGRPTTLEDVKELEDED
jgi:hypothetical protein